ncbi:LytR/AlgR family response regulator transcription factor [Reichenbachiella sp.]|uniref:LytR/AlgR family response regulator transcription factor n=1 Tax=Reichenbachiella sp. TaxID=2184521 RepID=UPI003BB00306
MRKRENSDHSLNELFLEVGIDQLEESTFDSVNKEVGANTYASTQLNILLSGEQASIQLAKRLADKLDIPFILLNSNDMSHATAEASITIPENYLNSSNQKVISALSKSLLGQTVDENTRITNDHPSQVSDAIFIKDNFNYIKVSFDQIDFVKSDGNYIEIHWANRVSVLKKTMKSFEEKAFGHAFHQVHRSYLINLNKITRIGPVHVYLGEYKIPLSKGKKEQLIEVLDTF